MKRPREESDDDDHDGGEAGGEQRPASGEAQQQRKGQGNKEFAFTFGNYDRYYGYRNGAARGDERMGMMKREWFEGKKVLDIGCNSGQVTIAIARDFAPASIVGIDIDAKLVKQAFRHLRLQFSLMRPGGGDRTPEDYAYFPISLPLTVGFLPFMSSPGPNFPDNVRFLEGDFVHPKSDEEPLGTFDAIVCFSVTKWVHLNFGDDGIRALFKRVFELLSPGGVFLLEPQLYQSYGSKSRRDERLKANHAAIKLKPDDFPEYLKTTVGFSTVELLPYTSTSTNAFRRPIYFCRK